LSRSWRIAGPALGVALALAGPARPDAWDPGDNSGAGGTVITPTTSSQTHGPHTMDGSTDTDDWFIIPMVAGRTYHVDTVGGVGFDYGFLYADSFGFTEVAYDFSGSGGGGQFSLDYTATATQNYYLDVEAFGAWSGSLHYWYSILPGRLVSQMYLAPPLPNVGQWVTVSVTVTNTGGYSVVNVLPTLDVTSGGSNLTLETGPVPTGPLTLVPGAGQTFVWTLSVNGTGVAALTASITGIDAGSGGGVLTTATGRVPAPHILIYGPTAGGQASHVPGTVATAWSTTVWSAATTADFAKFDAIVFADYPGCGVSTSTWNTAVANRSVWSAAITGNIIVIGTDEDFHVKPEVVNNGVTFAAAGAGPGLYASLSCAYESVTPAVPVTLLDQFGTFMTLESGCNNNVHIVASHPALAGLTDAYLSGWGCSTHEEFQSWPTAFMPLAIAVNPAGTYTSGDGVVGYPYILALGVTPVWGRPDLHKLVDPATAVDAGSPLTYTVSWSNVGQGTIYNLTLTDTLPNGTVYAAPSLSFWAEPDSLGTPSLVAAANAASVAGPWAAGEPVDGAAPPRILRWTVDRVLPGMSGLIRYSVRVSATLLDGSHVINSASATHTTDSIRYATESVSTTVTQGSIRLTKTATGDAFAQGEFLTYTLGFTNQAAYTVSNLRLWDTLPAGAGFIAATDGGVFDGTKVDWTLAALPPGATGTVSFTATMNGQAVTVGPNIARLDGDKSPGSPIPTVVSNGVTVRLKVPQLALVKSVTTGAAPQNAVVTYTLLVTSSGEDTAANIQVWDSLPAGAAYAACTVPPGGSCADTGSLVTWTLPPMATGTTATLTVDVQLAGPGPVVGPNRGEASYTSSYPAPRPNVLSNAVSVVVTAPDVAITKSANPPTVAAGGPFTYFLDLLNAGGDTAENVRVWDTLPPGATFVSASAGGVFDGVKVDWTLPDLPPGGGANISVDVVFTSTGPPVGPNTGWVEYTNSAGLAVAPVVSNTVMVTTKQAVLLVDKSALEDLAPVGSAVTWTVTISNVGSDVARYVSVWDTLPAGLAYGGCTGGTACSYDGTKTTWQLVDLPPGGRVVLTVSGTALPLLACPNVAEADYANSATVWQPTAVSAPVCVIPVQAVMTLTKTTPKAVYAAGESMVYTLTYANTGTDTAVNVTIWDSWSPNAVATGLTGPGLIQPGGRLAAWMLPPVPPGSGGAMTVTLTWTLSGCPVGEQVWDIATLDYANTANRNQPREVAGPLVVDIDNAGLVLTLTPSGWSVSQGSVLTYTVTYLNPCDDTAWNVVLSDTLPAGLVFLGASGAGSATGWALPPLPPGAGGTLTMTVSVMGVGSIGPMAIHGSFRNSALVPEPPVMSASVWINCRAPVLSVVKDSPAEAVTQGTITFTLQVTNTGTDTALGVTLVDTIPSPLKFVSASNGGVAAGRVVSWSIGTLPPGAAKAVTVTAQGPDEEADYALTNTGFATCLSPAGIHEPPETGSRAFALHPRLVVRVYPNPYEPGVAVRGTLKFSGLPQGAVVHLYTIAGVQLRSLPAGANHRAEWDGRNDQGSPVAAGFYLYAIECWDPSGTTSWIKGKVGVVR